MGVITSSKATRTPVFEIENHLGDFIFDDSPLESENEEEPEVLQPIQVKLPGSGKKRRAKVPKAKLPSLSDFDRNVKEKRSPKQRCGARKQRQLENAKLLVSRIDPEDFCEDLTDTLPETVSAFTQLFLEQQNMKAWNYFMDQSEARQDAILQNCRKFLNKNQRENKSEFQLLPENVAVTSEGPSGSKGVKIDSKKRTLLGQKHLPVGKIEQIESELVDYFLDSPDGVWVGSVPNNFDRLLLHTVAQYLSLRSLSIGAESDGKRETQVDNPRRTFTPPPLKLSEYLTQRRNR